MLFRIVTAIIFLFFVGCATTANIKNFSQSAADINFDEISKRDLNPNDPLWNLKGRSEYFISISEIDDASLFNTLIKSIENNGYTIINSNTDQKVIFGKRGMRMNEWNSLSGIYFRKFDDRYQIYIRVDITQDITGGWKENRAKKIAEEICRLSGKCL